MTGNDELEALILDALEVGVCEIPQPLRLRMWNAVKPKLSAASEILTPEKAESMERAMSRMAAYAPRAEELARQALSDINGFATRTQDQRVVNLVKDRLLQFLREALE